MSKSELLSTAQELKTGDLIDFLEKIDRSRLTWLKKALEAKSLNIDAQLDKAKHQRHETGKRADPSWFGDASFALKMTKSAVALMDAELASRKE